MTGDLELKSVSLISAGETPLGNRLPPKDTKPKPETEDFETGESQPQTRRAELEQAIADTEDTASGKLVIEQDEYTGRFVQKFVDEDTGEVIRQWPEEDFLEMVKQLDMTYGVLVDEFV